MASGILAQQAIGLHMFEEADRAEAMHQAGAIAYLTKSGPAENLLLPPADLSCPVAALTFIFDSWFTFGRIDNCYDASPKNLYENYTGRDGADSGAGREGRATTYRS